jgi:ribosome-associated protein
MQHLTTQAHVIKTQLPNPPPSLELLLQTVLDAADELKARDVVEIDVRGKSSVTDFMVVASGTSTRHVKSIADEVVRFAKKLDVQPLGVEGEREAEWVLVDLGDVVVHVMLPRVREFYALERLWTVGDEPPEGVDEYGGLLDAERR